MAKGGRVAVGGAAEMRRLFARAVRGRISTGKPVRAGDRTVIPLSRVWMAGGLGFGPDSDPQGGGGGGVVLSRPAGFIELDPKGARYRATRERPSIATLATAAAAGALAAIAITGAAAGAVGARRLVSALPVRRRRRGRRWP
jgi:uncharacterized spore protein YtfJ